MLQLLMPIVIKHLTSQEKNLQKECFQRDALTWLTSQTQPLSWSKLYQQIMDLEEYYPLRTETEILETYKSHIVKLISDQSYNIIELGAGDGTKTIKLLKEAQSQQKKVTYMPIDISQDSNETLAEILRKASVQIDAIIYTADYFQAIREINKNHQKRNLILYLGSTIGNMPKSDVINFLKEIYKNMKKSDLIMIGADLQKDYKMITQAYDDSKGVTARFNLNILTRMNRELGTNFIMQNFFRHCYFDAKQSSIKAYLVSKVEQEVYFKNANVTLKFGEFESIPIQESHKFSIKQIESLAESIGFTVVEHLKHQKNSYVVTIWRK